MDNLIKEKVFSNNGQKQIVIMQFMLIQFIRFYDHNFIQIFN
jgi:hypothetical protein